MLRITVILCTLLAVHAQFINVEVSPESNEVDDVEQRYTPEVLTELRRTQEEALLLYTEYSARNGGELLEFQRKMAMFMNETLNGIGWNVVDGASPGCKESLDTRLSKIKADAQRLASFNAENHHKFLLGHIIVLRMHLNKSEELIKKCEKTIKTCGIRCEANHRLKRWRRQALKEVHRVKEDMQHSRRFYKDIVTHGRRKLNNVRKNANLKANEASKDFLFCNEHR